MSAEKIPQIYPIVADTRRPYRLWDAKLKEHIPRRCYGVRLNAHKSALWAVTISKIGTTIEVYDSTNGMLLGQYTRKVNEVQIYMRKGELSHV